MLLRVCSLLTETLPLCNILLEDFFCTSIQKVCSSSFKACFCTYTHGIDFNIRYYWHQPLTLGQTCSLSCHISSPISNVLQIKCLPTAFRTSLALQLPGAQFLVSATNQSNLLCSSTDLASPNILESSFHNTLISVHGQVLRIHFRKKKGEKKKKENRHIHLCVYTGRPQEGVCASQFQAQHCAQGHWSAEDTRTA